ncbi:MAG: carboxymuconolactone decarboxylase family protein [Dehalococcoidia bacterium]
MARLPVATRESVPEDQREVFDEIVSGAGGVVPQTGPNSVTIHVPELAKRITSINQYLRNESSLDKKYQELSMLVAARANDCQHIWNAHAASAVAAGVERSTVDALRESLDLTDLPPDEEVVINFGREFFQTNRVSRGAYQAAIEQFGVQALVELTLVLGSYAMLAFAVNAFDTDLPSPRIEPLLPV